MREDTIRVTYFFSWPKFVSKFLKIHTLPNASLMYKYELNLTELFPVAKVDNSTLQPSLFRKHEAPYAKEALQTAQPKWALRVKLINVERRSATFCGPSCMKPAGWGPDDKLTAVRRALRAKRKKFAEVTIMCKT